MRKWWSQVLVRNDDGQWCALEPTNELPPGGFTALCADDLSPMLELETARYVAALQPGMAGSPDALCVTEAGGVSLVVSFFDQALDGAMLRLLECAGALVGMSLADFSGLCASLKKGETPGAWVQRSAGSGDAAAIDAAIASTLAAGSFELLAIAPHEHGSRIEAALRYLAASSAAGVRCFELSMQRAGSVQAVEALELPIGAGAPVATKAVQRDTSKLVDSPESAEVEAVPTPDEPIAEELAVEPEKEVELVELEAMLGAITSTNDAKVAKLASRLVMHCTNLFPDVTFARDGDAVVMQVWVDAGSEQAVLLELESNTRMTVLFDALQEKRRAELAAGLERIVPEFEFADDSTATPERLEVMIGEQLNDETLMDFLIETLTDVMGNGDLAELDSEDPIGFFADEDGAPHVGDGSQERASLVRVDGDATPGSRAGRLEPLHR